MAFTYADFGLTFIFACRMLPPGFRTAVHVNCILSNVDGTGYYTAVNITFIVYIKARQLGFAREGKTAFGPARGVMQNSSAIAGLLAVNDVEIFTWVWEFSYSDSI